LPTISFPPKWISCAGRGRWSWGSRRNDLADGFQIFKRLLAFSPLTLTLSPLRGEGTAAGNSHIVFCRRAEASPSFALLEAVRHFAKTQGAFLPLRSIGWRGEGRGEVRLSVANGNPTKFPPLTLALSPLRGEGIAIGRRGSLSIARFVSAALVLQRIGFQNL
jgi:hypothetical protein